MNAGERLHLGQAGQIVRDKHVSRATPICIEYGQPPNYTSRSCRTLTFSGRKVDHL
jgi:hypothetical protein